MARRKKVKVTPRRRGSKVLGPSFEGWENLTGQQFGRLKNTATDFYYREWKAADLATAFYHWMKEAGYTKTEIDCAKKEGARPTHGIYAKVLQDGCPDYNETYDIYWQSLAGTSGPVRPISDALHRWAKELIAAGEPKLLEKKKEEKAKANVYVPTIQERIRDQSFKMAADIDEWLEGWVNDKASFDPNGFDFKQHFKEVQPSQAHARKMKQFWEMELVDFNELERMPTKGQLAKMSEEEADQWEQLKEGYSYLKKSDIAKYRKAIDALTTELDFIIDQAKAKRKPRKPKVKSASKQVEKLKFCKADTKYSLASIDPATIVGANELWVFNVKTRKLGKYIASNQDPRGMNREGTGLSVKGTTIQGYDENLSIQKTLRKPPEQLKEFKGAGKVALRKFLDEIPTTDTKLNGRCSPVTVLLKVS